MTQEITTDVVIIGAGPAGLLLSELLAQEGVSSVIIERTSKAAVLSRIRAGVLERGTLEALEKAGCAERLMKERMDHDFLTLSFDGELCDIPIRALTGHQVMVYGQTEITKDLIDAAERRDQKIFWDCPDASLHDIESAAPKARFGDGANATVITGRFIAGCDGFHGISRSSIPAAQQKLFERTYPFGWLGVLVDQPPVSEHVIYANHADGFALASMRSLSRSRYYVQTKPGETLDDWTLDAFWEALRTRLGGLGREIKIGDPLEMSIAPLRSFVSTPMRYGRLFLAGDAAHIVPPTGAKGLNLAVADVYRLSKALIQWKTGDERGLEVYSRDALARVWKVERFSWYLTRLLHQFPEDSPFEKQMQRAEFEYIRSSDAAQMSIAENYVGLDF